MGELSQRIGKKLEHYGNSIFEHLEWKILAQDVQIDCIRAAHKNAKSSDKKTHGVDILAGYYNPFTKRQEAFIIECKHREWSNFIPSNLSLWVTLKVSNMFYGKKVSFPYVLIQRLFLT